MAAKESSSGMPAAGGTASGSAGTKTSASKGRGRISALAARFEQGNKAEAGPQRKPEEHLSFNSKTHPASSARQAKELSDESPRATHTDVTTQEATDNSLHQDAEAQGLASPAQPGGHPGRDSTANSLLPNGFDLASARHLEKGSIAGGTVSGLSAEVQEKSVPKAGIQDATDMSSADAIAREVDKDITCSMASHMPAGNELQVGSEEKPSTANTDMYANSTKEHSKHNIAAASSDSAAGLSSRAAITEAGPVYMTSPAPASVGSDFPGSRIQMTHSLSMLHEERAPQDPAAAGEPESDLNMGRDAEVFQVPEEIDQPFHEGAGPRAVSPLDSDASNPFGAPLEDGLPSDAPSTAEGHDSERTGVSDGDFNPFDPLAAEQREPDGAWDAFADRSLKAHSIPVLPMHVTTAAVEIASRGPRSFDVFEVRGSDREPEVSPFGGAESYTLSPTEDFQLSPPASAFSSPLGTVPEDGPSPPDDLQLSTSPLADVIKPDSLKLAKVKAPRVKPSASCHTNEPSRELRQSSNDSAVSTEHAVQHRSSEDSELGERMRINVQQQQTEAGMDMPVFNPFAAIGDDSAFLEEAMSPAVDDGMFNMEFDQPTGEIPTVVGNLDFGATGRRGSGVIGPRLEAFDTGRIADKFEVQEGEDMEIKQIMWVADNLEEELALANAAFETVDAVAAEHRKEVDELRIAWEESANELEEIEEELASLHSRLEQQLLTKLEQEDEIRETVEKLKAVRAETAALDRELQEKEEKRRELQRLVDEQKALSPEGQAAVDEAQEGSSPHSHMSSPWATSDDSDEEPLDLAALPVQRPAASTLSEDNKAKMKEKGGSLGGSWLRSVLGGRRSSKELPVPPPTSTVDSDSSHGRVRVIGAGQSHTEQPTTAAELMPIPLEIEPEPAH